MAGGERKDRTLRARILQPPGHRPEAVVIAGAIVAPQPIDVLRPADLLVARFSFVNLTYDTDGDGRRILRRRVAARPAFLLLDLQPQHIVEQAFLETAGGSPTPDEQVQPNGSPAPPPTPDLSEDVPNGPVQARISTHTRLAFVVGGEQILPTVDGLLTAAATLPLSVVPHARAATRRPSRFVEEFHPHLVAELPAGTLGARVANGIALSRAMGAARVLTTRLGSDDAQRAVAGLQVVGELGISDRLVAATVALRARPIPRAPSSTETSIELPWRLKISPTDGGGFTHATGAVSHEGRTELWHSRFGVRTVTPEGVRVDEDNPAERVVRAIWARDFDQFGFTASPLAPTDFPNADGKADNPRFRKSLNSRDRMMLVHESSNFTMRRNGRPWDPHVVDVERLMLTALGGWLRSEFASPDLPDGQLTISEWKHRATMGRDHEVKVVYAGHLFPFGHQASLVKVTERKFHPGQPGNPAALRQRFFLVVRKQTLTYPSTATVQDNRAYVPVKGAKRLDLVMPFASVSVLTRITPSLDPISNLLSGGMVFTPAVDGAPFLFRILATDRGGRVQEYSAPLMFVERDHNVVGNGSVAEVIQAYWNQSASLRRQALGGQKLRFAPAVSPDGTGLDTDMDTSNLYFDALPLTDSVPQDDPRFHPILRDAEVVVPAMSTLAGANTPVTVAYPAQFAANGFAANAAAIFLAVANTPKLDFSSQGDRSGGFVTPNLAVTALSGLSGPVGGSLDKAVAGTLTPQDLFQGITAKLFGIVPLTDLLEAVGLTPDRFPQFVGQTLDRVVSLLKDLQRLVALAEEVDQRFAAEADAQVQAARAALNGIVGAAQALVTAVTSFDPDTDIAGQLGLLAGQLPALAAAVDAAKQLPAAVRNETAGIIRRLADQVEDVAEIVGLIEQFAQGISLPPVVKARLHWSTQFRAWPAGGDAVFQPRPKPGQAPADATATLDLAVEMQGPTKADKPPTALVTCSITPFALQLIGDDPYIALKVERIEFLLAPGRKPDVNVVFEDGGVVFGGPLSFVNTLKDLIPFDGFSDPPYLDVTAQGIKAGFDLGVPSLTIGVMSLANISLGAHLRVPFIDDSLDFTFNFCTREHPFRLTVWLFGGGGFFGITVTPERCLVLEAAFEFGAAVALDFGVASGSIECMAGIYFRLETGNSVLTGYFRLRGEVDVLGLISASIELYLELTYEFASGKAVGRATLTIEVEVLFLSFSVSISCEKKFKGSNADPTFAEVMGPTGIGAPRPWDDYCAAFAA
jgi:hypothetical protein